MISPPTAVVEVCEKKRLRKDARNCQYCATSSVAFVEHFWSGNSNWFRVVYVYPTLLRKLQIWCWDTYTNVSVRICFTRVVSTYSTCYNVIPFRIKQSKRVEKLAAISSFVLRFGTKGFIQFWRDSLCLRDM